MEPTAFNNASAAVNGDNADNALSDLSTDQQIMMRLFTSVVNKVLEEAKTNGNISA